MLFDTGATWSSKCWDEALALALSQAVTTAPSHATYWPEMFLLAVELCRDGLPEGTERDLIIKMLEFGAKLEADKNTEEVIA